LVISCDKKKLNSNEIFENLCGVIIKSLENLNIHSCYKPPNDILLNKKKISGSAILKKENIFLIHGTILLDTDLVLMKKVLRCNTSDKVTTISNELSNPPDFNEIKTQIKKEFEYYFDTGFEESELTKYEEDLIEKLMKQRYLNESWNYAR
jgi:lipoate-protein ligase A